MSEARGLILTFTIPELRDDLSVVLQTDDNLWVASDETTCLERLRRLDGEGRYGDHARFDLAELIPLPHGRRAEDEGEAQEIDIEGLAFSPPYLWVVGSHSLKRKKPDKSAPDLAKQIERLACVEREANRYLLARIPLTRGEDGQWRPERDTPEGSACVLRVNGKGNDLTKALAKDEHLAPFLAIPSKDNGLDVEGLAVDGSRVFLGLRGPVLRGWAVILELRLVEKDGALRLKKLGAGKARLRKHFIDLGGLGIRELCLDGDDMLILAGPTMDLDGPVAVYRWRNAIEETDEALVPLDRLSKVCDLPFGVEEDHAEGLALYRERPEDPASLLAVYDSPGAARKPDAHSVRADLLPLACAAPAKDVPAEAKAEAAAKTAKKRKPAAGKAKEKVKA